MSDVGGVGGRSTGEDTITLWRPVGPKELTLIQQAEMRAFPPRLPDQPIFYPVLTEEYAVRIARDWNVPASGAGFVTRFRIRRSFTDSYVVQEAGGRDHQEYWIPAGDLDAFNAAIVGPIEVVRSFRSEP
ncbi:MAG: ADP-ribosylation/crystallin J1 [Alphaproteobacteria bacterium]|nr:ADP-ribosylation/crystallin J1 [Alphaproteobacteria bacterium]